MGTQIGEEKVKKNKYCKCKYNGLNDVPKKDMLKS